MFFSFFFFKQKTAYWIRISDWSSDVCPSDLQNTPVPEFERLPQRVEIVTMLGIGITRGPRRIELVRIAHADQVTGDQPSQPGAMRHDIAPQIGRRRIAVLEEDRIAGPFIDIGHAPALDLNEFLLAKWLCAEAHRYSP